MHFPSRRRWSVQIYKKSETLHQLFLQRVADSPDAVAYKSRASGSTSSWIELSWQQVAERVALWGEQLKNMGCKPGDRLAILLENSPEWVSIDQAAFSMQMVTTPLFVHDRPANMAYVISHSGSRILVLRDIKQWERLKSIVADSALERVLLVKSGWENSVELKLIWQREVAVELGDEISVPDGLATIVYTSGTTGNPKGVMLSHRNILENCAGAFSVARLFPTDLLLSFLPLSHALERTVGCYLPMMAGSTVAFSRSVLTVQRDLVDLKPTVLIAVPRLFEKIDEQIEEKLSTATWIVKLLAARATKLFSMIIGRKVRNTLGGRLRVVVSGGAPLAKTVANRLISFGVPILQGYGLTEAGPVVSSNRLEGNRPDSVGMALPDTEIKIQGENRELLVRGPGVMLGYWRDQSETNRVIDSEGWLHTGDVAKVKGGYLYITGRIKDILVLSNGEKISPPDIEMAILQDPLIDQVVVVGEGRPFLSALVVVNEHGQHPSNQELIRRIAYRMGSFPGYAKVKRLIILNEPWTIEQGLMTPTMKLRREKILEYYQEDLDALYG